MRKPKGVVAVYDSGPDEGIDRYTLVLSLDYTANVGYRQMLGMSGSPSHPQGVSQFGEGLWGDHLGKRIKFQDLPENVQAHAIARLTD